MALVSEQSSLADITAAMMSRQVIPVSQPIHKPREEDHEVKSPDV